MTRRNCRDILKRVGFLLPIQVLAVLTVESVLAQSAIVPDNTLGEESSQVRTNVNGLPVEVIEGGAQRGSNLFHSFSEFNVSEGRGAYFANPTGVENILGRVTGANPSQILGTLGVLGNADLFLINPNGIIFGQNARLDVNGSFIGSTADSLLFPDGEFSARDTQAKPLLTVNVPIGLGLGDNPGDIVVNKNELLLVPIGETLALVGGNVSIDGSWLLAVDGNIELGGLTAQGEIDLNEDGSLSFPDNVVRGDVSLANGTNLFVAGEEGGAININARNFSLTSGSFVAAGINVELGSPEAQAGDIIIDSTEDVLLDGATVTNSNVGTGSAGNIEISARNITAINGGNVTSFNDGKGETGDITLTATEDVIFNGLISPSINGVVNFVSEEATGNVGSINITAQNLTLTNGAFVESRVAGNADSGSIDLDIANTITVDGFGITVGDSGEKVPIASSIATEITPSGNGNSGNININTKTLFLTRNGAVSATILGSGNAGNININAEAIAISQQGSPFIEPSNISSNALSGFISDAVEANAGNIIINTNSLSIADGGSIGASSSGISNSGSIVVNATDNLSLDGTGLVFVPDGTKFLDETTEVFSSISTSTTGNPVGNAGSIEINTPKLSLNNFAQISAVTSGEGTGGDITIDTGQLNVVGTSQIIASTFTDGNAGSLNITATDSIELSGASERGRSGLLVSALVGGGNGGDLSVFTDELIIRDGATISASNFPSIEGATEPGSGSAGILTIEANSITLDNNAVVTAATQSGEGGNIDLQIADNLTVQDNSTISAQAFNQANGGNLTVNADTIFLDNQSLIEADTDSGTQGNITLNTQLLTLRNNSNITTNASGSATGGNITINAEDGFIIAVPEENSDITANAERASGGQVTINAQSLFGIEAREQNTPLSDITATSDLGVQFGGDVTINTPEVDPESGLNELPTVPIDADAIIAQNFCRLENDRIAGGSSFTIIGKGGLPPTADDPITNQTRIVDWATPTEEPLTPNRNQPEINSNNTVAENTQPVIQQARGWAKTKDGKIVLTADAPIIAPQTGEIAFPNCTVN